MWGSSHGRVWVFSATTQPESGILRHIKLHGSRDENELYHANVMERMRLTCCVVPQGKALSVCV